MTEAAVQTLLAAPPLAGTYGPTMPAVRLPAGDVRLTAPLVVRGRYSPEVGGDSMHGTRLVWDGPPDRYPVEFRGCSHPKLSNLTVVFSRRAAGGVLVCNDIAGRVTNTAAVIERVCIDAREWAKVQYGIDFDNTAGGVEPNQNGEHHAVRDCVIGGVHTGVRIGWTQAHRCIVAGTSFSACRFGVDARLCGSQLVEDCNFANVGRCLSFGDLYAGAAIARRINAEGCEQLVRFSAYFGSAVLEDVRCDGMRPLPPGPGLTDGDVGGPQTYFTAAVMIGMQGVVRVRRVQLSAAGQPHPIRIESHRTAPDVSDLQVWRWEGDPKPVWLSRYGDPRRFEFCALGTVMKSGAQPVVPFAFTTS